MLPVTLTLGNQQLVLQQMRPEKLTEAYALVCTEASLNDDIGWDEFTSEECLSTLMNSLKSFELTDPITGELRAFIILTPTLFSRTDLPIWVDGFYFCDPQIKAAISKSVVELCFDLAADLGYEEFVVNAFGESSRMHLLLTEGFTPIGCIPKSGYLQGKGWVDGFIMCKHIKQGSRENKYISQKDQVSGLPVISSGTSSNPLPGNMGLLCYFKQKPRLTSMPVSFTLKSGIKATIGYIQEDEIPQVYEMFREAAKEGEGYSTDEFQTLELFRYYIVDYGHSFVARNEETSEILFAASITPNSFCRSMDPLYCDHYIVVNPKQRGKRLGFQGSQILHMISKSLGYTGVIVDYLSDNLPSMRILKVLGHTPAARIPRGAIGKDGKMLDVMVEYVYLTHMPSLESKL